MVEKALMGQLQGQLQSQGQVISILDQVNQMIYTKTQEIKGLEDLKKLLENNKDFVEIIKLTRSLGLY